MCAITITVTSTRSARTCCTTQGKQDNKDQLKKQTRWLAYVEDGLRLGGQALLHVGLEPPKHERPEDLVQLVDNLLLRLLVVDLEVEPLIGGVGRHNNNNNKNNNNNASEKEAGASKIKTYSSTWNASSQKVRGGKVVTVLKH